MWLRVEASAKKSISGYTLCVEYTTVYDVIVSKTQLIYFPYCLYTQGRKRENVNRGEYVLFFVLVALCCWALVGKWKIGMVYIPTSLHPYIRSYVHTFIRSYVHTFIRSCVPLCVHPSINKYLHPWHVLLFSSTKERELVCVGVVCMVVWWYGGMVVLLPTPLLPTPLLPTPLIPY